ncbi:MAG: hypothetical protein IKG61_02485, partial [Selenomonadaceae bacterium]|nr:hypothetical protein [Selenomonadaceae bacterium]
SALMGIGEASGENATVDAVKAAIDSPLLETSLQGARGVLLNIMGATDSLSMLEINEASTTVQEAAHPEAEIIWGVSVDESLGDKVSVTVIATRFGDEEAELAEPAPPPTKKINQPPTRSNQQQFNQQQFNQQQFNQQQFNQQQFNQQPFNQQEPPPYNRPAQPKQETPNDSRNSFQNIIPDFFNRRNRR